METQQDYEAFLAQKIKTIQPAGFDADGFNPQMFDWQMFLAKWMLKRGRAAIFGGTGTGKTIQECEVAQKVFEHVDRPVLMFAPLAVAEQTASVEGPKFGYKIQLLENQADAIHGLNIVNYQKIHKIDPAFYGAVICDEASIFKGLDGKTRKALNDFVQRIGYRFAYTATPAPNDFVELLRIAEWLGIMSEKEAIALFFTQDGNDAHNFKLKPHAEESFWRWVSSWAIAYRMPSDLGFDNGDYSIPELIVKQVVVPSVAPEGMLFDLGGRTLNQQRVSRRATLSDRVKICADIANQSSEPFTIWAALNPESEALAKAIPDAIEVAGKHNDEYKKSAFLGFASGKHRVMVTKGKIGAHGMNWQHCGNVMFCGRGNSFEEEYQELRRSLRYPRKEPVTAWYVVSESDGDIVANIERKEREHNRMMDKLISNLKHAGQESATREEMTYEAKEATGEGWVSWLGDSCERVKELADNSIDEAVTSIPFASMWVYTNSARDIGNCKTRAELVEHFGFMLKDLLRAMKPGRSFWIHLTQEIDFKNKGGDGGLNNFRDDIVHAMKAAGWIWGSERAIGKNPQAKATRTKDAGLQFKNLTIDAARLRGTMPDFLLQFVKPGDNAVPVRAGDMEKYGGGRGEITNDEWIEWAGYYWQGSYESPDGISETDVLNVAIAKDAKDSRHLCPLQLGVIERCIKLGSNPGELILDPFSGIASTGYKALLLNRCYLGIELKPSYYETGLRNLREAERLAKEQQCDLFDFAVSQADAEAEPEGEAIDVPVTRKEGVPLIAEPGPDRSKSPDARAIREVEKPKRTRKAKAATVASAPVAEADDFFNFA